MRLRTFLLLIRGRERLRDEETHPYQGSRTRTTLPPNGPLPSSSFFFVQKRRSQYKNNECNHFFCHFSSFLSPRLFYFSQHSFASLLWFSGISEAKNLPTQMPANFAGYVFKTPVWYRKMPPTVFCTTKVTAFHDKGLLKSSSIPLV